MNKRAFVTAFSLATLCTHSFFQFLAWANHPGNRTAFADSPTWLARNGFTIVSFPLFWLLPEAQINRYFGLIMWSNSIIWTVAATAFAFRFSEIGGQRKDK
jgi:hypothetical protein